MPHPMKDWLFLYFKDVVPEINQPEDLQIERFDGLLVSVFKAKLPNLDLLEEHPRFLKTLQGVVAAAGRSENRRYVIELERQEAI